MEAYGAPPMVVDLRPSPGLMLFILLLHLAALLVLCRLLPQTPLLGLLVPWVAVGLLRQWRHYSRIRRIVRRENGDWILLDRQGRHQGARLRRRPLLLPFLVALEFSFVAGGTQYLLLLPDNSDPEQVRRLRVRLRRERYRLQVSGMRST